jgi:PAP2 superfamily protein
MPPRPALTIETSTLLQLFFGAACARLLVKSAPRIYKERLDAIDNHLLRVLRRPENLSVPIGPKWMPQAAKDVTSLGSGTNLTIATGILAGFLCLNRRFRAMVSRQVTGPLAKTYFLSMAVALAVIVGVTRVYLGVHYPSDVLAGWAAGSLWSSVCAQGARWLQRQGGVEAPTETGEARSEE